MLESIKYDLWLLVRVQVSSASPEGKERTVHVGFASSFTFTEELLPRAPS